MTLFMKKTYVTLSMLLLCGALMAQGGIKFNEGQWNDLLAKAKAQNAIIFVDAYTTWCGPCKMMASQVFTQKEVGDFYNSKFINAKIDMEKGEGIELAQRYSVQAYPTFLFVDGDGNIAHRAVGYKLADEFIELGKVALDSEKRLGGLVARYDGGNRDPQFLYDLAMARYEAMDGGHMPVAEEYLATQSDWNTPQNMELIYYIVDNPDSKLFDYMVKNRAAFEEQFGEDAIIDRVQQLIMQKAFANGNEGESALNEVDKMYAKVYPEQAARLSANFRMSYYNMLGDVNNFAKSAVDYFDKYPSDDFNELNNVAWTFYESIQDKDMLKKALGWAKRSVELESQYFNNDTLAALYFKLGEKKKGKKAAKTAIEIAKKNGEDYSGTTQLLEQWNAN
jgi:thiol-disulfide isomerase/thioredoxin